MQLHDMHAMHVQSMSTCMYTQSISIFLTYVTGVNVPNVYGGRSHAVFLDPVFEEFTLAYGNLVWELPLLPLLLSFDCVSLCRQAQ